MTILAGADEFVFKNSGRGTEKADRMESTNEPRRRQSCKGLVQMPATPPDQLVTKLSTVTTLRSVTCQGCHSWAGF